MNKKQMLWMALMVISIVGAGIAVAQQPTMVALQGKVTDNVGNLVDNGNLRVTISTSDSCETGLIYDYTYNNLIQAGLFNILLGNDSAQLNMTYNSDYYACTWINGQLVANAQQITRTKFRGGQGQIQAAQIANGTIGNNWTFTNPPSITITTGPTDFRLLKEMLETLAHNQGQIITAEKSYRETMYDNFSTSSGSYTNVVHNVLGSQVVLAPATGGTPIEQADFTGGSMDSTWNLSSGATFDAANDEVDLSNPSGTVTYNGPDVGNGTFVAAYRNIAGGGYQVQVRAFGITMTDSLAVSNNIIDGISGTATLTSTNRYLRIQRVGSYVKTEYSSDGNSWSTLNEVYSNSNYGGTTSVGTTSTDASQRVSVYNLTIHGISPTGTFVSSTATASSTVKGVLLTGEENLAGSGTVTYSVSLDNGANYLQVTKGELTQINSNQGNQIKVKADLTSAGNATSLLNYVLYYFMW